MKFSKITNVKSVAHGAMLRWTGVAGLLGGAAILGSALMTATPADATISFCTKTVCIGSANGCSTQTTVGVVIEAEDGDSFIDSHGIKWTCNHGQWIKTATIRTSSGISTVGKVQDASLSRAN
jgi:hypothetical protein